jgi:hypothetical protein
MMREKDRELARRRRRRRKRLKLRAKGLLPPEGGQTVKAAPKKIAAAKREPSKKPAAPLRAEAKKEPT